MKYQDCVYHVQTEDSGVDNPHIITHLFVGGNIIESAKTSYAQLLGSEDLEKQLVALMQGQHKQMLKGLIRGQFDAKLAERSVNAATLSGPAPLNVDPGAQHRSSFGRAAGTSAAAPQAAKPIAPASVPIAAPAPLLYRHRPLPSQRLQPRAFLVTHHHRRRPLKK
ncbi:MAG: hypothetical protein R3C68_04345 [Myxococcota bacterium]